MSVAEVYETSPSTVEANAEAMASEVRANLVDYIQGGRDRFDADFSINIGSEVHDIAHKIFLESLGVEAYGEGYLVIGGGTKLYVRELCFDEDDGGIPYHLTYSSDPLD